MAMAQLLYNECMKESRAVFCLLSQDWGCLICHRKAYQLAEDVHMLNMSLRKVSETRCGRGRAKDISSSLR